MQHLSTPTFSRFLLLFLLCGALCSFGACKQDKKAPPAQATENAEPEPEFFAGHSITDSTDEITDRNTHYKEILKAINDPFAGKETFGPAHKRVGHYGMDISHYQRDIQWAQVKADSVPHALNFVFIKATQGKQMVDSHFKQNWEEATKHNLRVGAYHFYRYKDDPLEQAANYIKNVALTKGNLLPVVDVELDCAGCTAPEIPKDQLIANLKKYVAAIEGHYKVKPLIYTYEGFFQEYLNGHFPDHYFWMALYRNKPPVGWLPSANKTATKDHKVALWQFTDSGKVPGITGTVDMNFMIGEFEKEVLIK